MSEWKQKRFWKDVSVTEQDRGFGIALDGRPVKTPAKAGLIVPSRALADAIAAEWDAQQDEVRPLTMPFTRSANAAIDKVQLQHDEVVRMLSDYGDSDLLCYRADGPAELVARQAQAWDPVLDWAAERFGARLMPRSGVMHEPQQPEALERLGNEVRMMDSFVLTGLHDLVTISGSLVLGLAVLEGHVSAHSGWELSRLDEAWQEEQWGIDEEAQQMAAMKRDAFLHAERVCKLVSGTSI